MKIADLLEAKVEKTYTITKTRSGDRKNSISGTLAELIDSFGYTLETGASYQHEKGNKKINRKPTNIKSLVDNLNAAVNNAAANGYAGVDFTFVEGGASKSTPQVAEAASDSINTIIDRELQKYYKVNKTPMSVEAEIKRTYTRGFKAGLEGRPLDDTGVKASQAETLNAGYTAGKAAKYRSAHGFIDESKSKMSVHEARRDIDADSFDADLRRKYPGAEEEYGGERTTNYMLNGELVASYTFTSGRESSVGLGTAWIKGHPAYESTGNSGRIR